MLDRDGYRPNVGIILINSRNSVFWGKRIREHSWQFPQGGIHRGESPQRAMLRELHEEIGLHPQHVRIVARTRDWLRYDVPTHWVRREWRGHYRGQKQIWFLLRLLGRDSDIDLRASNHPEFDAWRWNDYWVPLESVIEFKRGVYTQALNELAKFVFPGAGRKRASRAAGTTTTPHVVTRALADRITTDDTEDSEEAEADSGAVHTLADDVPDRRRVCEPAVHSLRVSSEK